MLTNYIDLIIIANNLLKRYYFHYYFCYFLQSISGPVYILNSIFTLRHYNQDDYFTDMNHILFNLVKCHLVSPIPTHSGIKFVLRKSRSKVINCCYILSNFKFSCLRNYYVPFCGVIRLWICSVREFHT